MAEKIKYTREMIDRLKQVAKIVIVVPDQAERTTTDNSRREKGHGVSKNYQ